MSLCINVDVPTSCIAGYAVLEDFATQDEVRQLREQAEKLIRGDAGGGDTAVFSTTNQVRTVAAVNMLDTGPS